LGILILSFIFVPPGARFVFGASTIEGDHEFFGVGEPLLYRSACSGERLNVTKAFELMQYINGSRLREWVWRWMIFDGNETSLKQAYVEALNNIVAQAKSQGIEIMGMVQDFPSWMTGIIDDNQAVPSRNLTEYRSFLQKYEGSWFSLAHAFPNITIWEIGNEYNLDEFLHPEGYNKSDLHSPRFTDEEKADIVTDLLLYGSRGIRRGNPNATTVMGGLGPVENSKYGNGIYDIADFLDSIYKRIESGNWSSTDPNDFFEVGCWHPYLFAHEANNTNWVEPNIAVRNVMVAHGDADKKVVFSEFGYSDVNLTESQVADHLKKAYLIAKENFRPWLETIYWFRLIDPDPNYDINLPPTEYGFGLFKNPAQNYALKHAAEAYREITCAKIGDFTFEKRGVWVWATSFSSNPDEARAQMVNAFSLFKNLSLNIIFFLVKSSEGRLYFNSTVYRDNVDPNFAWDPLAMAVEVAHGLGLELHAWFCVFHDIWLARTNQSLATVHIDGTSSDEWVCPSSDYVQKRTLDTILEVARNYDVDGVHLDYIRFENRSYCYCPRCRAEFRSLYGFDPKERPDSKEWIEWRSWQIESFVLEVKASVELIKLEAKVSATVFPILQDAATNRFQNWKVWAEKRIISFLVPITYTNDIQQFRSWAENITESIKQRVPLLMGIGLYTIAELPSENRSKVLEAQIEAARDLGAQGWILFRYNYLYDDFVNVIGSKPPILDKTAPYIHNPIKEPLADEVQPYENVTIAVVVCDAGSGVNQVVLSCTMNRSFTWTNITMTKVDENVYVAQITGFPECTNISYKIIAYDIVGSCIINDDAGQYYTYYVIPEFNSTPLITLLIISATITTIKKYQCHKRKCRKPSPCLAVIPSPRISFNHR
jgi:uncharacterized lipoprotein YddW (UPF0748 family)